MMTITVQAVYKDGVLYLDDKPDLPDNTPVLAQITPLPAPASTPPSLFGSLAGIWGHLSEAGTAQMEQDLAEIRRQTAERIERLARER